ncbi:MAG: hypothetical protein U0176_10980 [Bacteroidia bacterium]
MEKSKLVILLRTLDAWELRNLRDLVESPFFNKQEIVLKLLDELLLILKRGEQCPSLEGMHERIWPTLKYDHQRLRYVMTDLTRLVEQWLIQKQMARRDGLQGRLLLEGLGERKLDKYFAQGLEKTLDQLEKDGFRDADYHYERFRLHQLARGFESPLPDPEGPNWAQQMLDDLQHFHLGTRLRLVCDIVSRSSGQIGEDEKSLIEELRKRIGRPGVVQPSAIAVYETLLHMLSHPEPAVFYSKFRMQLRAVTGQFHREEMAELYGFALNYSVQLLNRGVEGALQDILIIYQEQLEGKILLEDGVFSAQHFKNIVTVGLRLKEYDWTRGFIESYSKHLPEALRLQVVTYSQAALHYVLSEYAQCRKLLESMQFGDAVYELEGKILLMKSLYELSAWEALSSLCDRQIRFLQQASGLTQRQRDFHGNFVRFLKRLVDHREGRSRTPLGALIGEIEAARDASDLKWLRQKVDEAVQVRR